jgi:hypothetical protein
MKNILKYSLVFALFSTAAAFSQKSTLDSPHNYKRPVIQQNKVLAESSTVPVPLNDSFKYQNSISSVHNYKRQGNVDFASESAIVINLPSTQPLFLSPLLSANYYKSQFHKTNLGKQTLQNYVSSTRLVQNTNQQQSRDTK